MKHTASAYNTVPLWEPVAFLPCQMADRTGRAHRPELRLVAAMLEDALQCVFRNATAVCGPRRREFLEACDWLWDDSHDWPFTFANVCDLLNLEGSAVRQCVRLIIATQRSNATADERKDKVPERPLHMPRTWKRDTVPPLRPSHDRAAELERLGVVVWDEV
jgi:hypothetical protein